jgi:parvulin-like peptidyl-prolyl isomerase
MSTTIPFLLLALALVSGCGGEGASTEPVTEPEPQLEPALAALRANVASTAARAEHADATVEVAHILVAFEGSGTGVKGRTREQAEQRAAELLARVQAGEDFEAVRAASTDDPGPPTYKMSLGASTQPKVIPRSGMVKAFGDVGWRLAIGEIGVAAHDPTASRYGWHIIKRVK